MKRFLKVFAVALSLCLCVFGLVACANPEVTKEEFEAAIKLDATNMTIKSEAKMGEITVSAETIIAGDKIKSIANIDGKETISYYEKSGTKCFMYTNDAWTEIDERMYNNFKSPFGNYLEGVTIDMFEFKNGVYSSKANSDEGILEGDIKLTFADKKLVKIEIKESEAITTSTISYSGSVTTPARS